MNILCISYFDNGGQMQALSNALNKYTNHNCHHLNIYQSYLKYDVDIKYTDHTKEFTKSLINNSDFFIFSEVIPSELRKLDILKKLNWNNTIYRCYGSKCRKDLNRLREWWYKHFVVFTSGGIDPTIHPYIGFVAYHIPNIYDFNKFPKPDKIEPLKICHTYTMHTNMKLKNTPEIIETLNKLKKKYNIKPIIIHNKPWKESLKIKANCHITIDQFKLTAYGGSAIESMYLKHAVLSSVSPLVKSLHPDIPLVNTTIDNLYPILEELIINKDKIDSIGEAGHEYTIREHSAKKNIIKWNYLIKWVAEGLK